MNSKQITRRIFANISIAVVLGLLLLSCAAVVDLIAKPVPGAVDSLVAFVITHAARIAAVVFIAVTLPLALNRQ